jgi:BirA family biotin operon repressor/biotin-[acetyl-CoA-carboxylase] ligase
LEVALRPRLATAWLGRAFEWHDQCASTNDLCAARGRTGGAEGLVVAADTQSAGRGRLGRTWHSPPGAGLYFSILLRPARPPVEIPPLTLLAGAAVARGLAALGPEVAPRLKWPNDVLLAESAGGGGGAYRKVAGILTEMTTEGERVGQVVVGVGLNVNTLELPEDLAARATSLRRVAGRAFDRAEVLAAVLGAFEPLYDAFRAGGPAAAVEAWQGHALLGTRWRVTAPGKPLEGIALGVDPDGALRLRDDAGTVHRVVAGEVIA